MTGSWIRIDLKEFLKDVDIWDETDPYGPMMLRLVFNNWKLSRRSPGEEPQREMGKVRV
ncbi:MAG: hypothetical protein ACUVQ0_06485 [Thermoproteota archaeon]